MSVMDGLSAGADIATMLTGLSAMTAAYVFVRGQLDGLRAQRAYRQRRCWHGYIDVGGIDTWHVRLAEPPGTGGAVVQLEFTQPDGSPTPEFARSARLVVERCGMLSRPPTTGELEFLKYLRKHEGYGQRNLLIR